MNRNIEPLWTIDELGAQVALALSVDYEGAASGRVRDLPDQRAIRYYATLGLLDRPAAMRGRTAYYGRRHLMQLVAIKRLQARGLSLAEIQQRLLGLTDAALVRLAQLPADLPPAPLPPPESGAPDRSGSFWRTTPEPGERTHEEKDDNFPPASRVSPAEAEEAPTGPLLSQGPVLQGVPLTSDVLLLWPAARPVDAEELAALRLAAAPLVKLLHRRRLIDSGKERN
jgi:hypothetical protein